MSSAATQASGASSATSPSTPVAPSAASSVAENPSSALPQQIIDLTGAASDAAASIAKAPTGEELKKALITQVEYIFSKEYLASDPALVAQLNHDFFLPISVVVDLPVIRLLTSDAELVKTALKSTDKIVIDEAKQMARPAIKLVQRNTIIIRDVPEATPQDQIRGLFGDFAKHIIELKPDIESTFFVKLDDEEVTTKAFFHLRQQKFNNAPVQARVKSENILRSFSYYPTAPSMPAVPFALPPGLDPRSVPFVAAPFSRPPYPFIPNQGFYDPYLNQRNNVPVFDQNGKPIDRKKFVHKVPRMPAQQGAGAAPGSTASPSANGAPVSASNTSSAAGASGQSNTNDRRRNPNYTRDGQRGRTEGGSSAGAAGGRSDAPRRGGGQRGGSRDGRKNERTDGAAAPAAAPKKPQETPILPSQFPPLATGAAAPKKKRSQGAHDKPKEHTVDAAKATEAAPVTAEVKTDPPAAAAPKPAESAVAATPLSAAVTPFTAAPSTDTAVWTNISSNIKKPPTNNSPQISSKPVKVEAEKKEEEKKSAPKPAKKEESKEKPAEKAAKPVDLPAPQTEESKKDEDNKSSAPSWADKARAPKASNSPALTDKKLTSSSEPKPAAAAATAAAATPVAPATSSPAPAAAPAAAESADKK